MSSLGREGQFAEINFEVKAGEIVAFAGLVGSGRSEVIRAIFGIDGYEHGNVEFYGKPLKKGRPGLAMSKGIAFVPEDRRQQGLFMPVSIVGNISISILNKLSRFGLIRKAAEAEVAAEWVKKLQIKLNSLEDSVDRLSGGNQQKVVLAKWLSTDPKLLIIDEPTRGIDVGTKAEVHRFLSEQASKGLAYLWFLASFQRSWGVADRILVMREGKACCTFHRR